MTKSLFLIRSFAGIAIADPARLFWICAGAHLLVWTIIPTLVTPNVLTDVIEGYAWGHEWPLGTYKHPPLQAWILETLATLTGRAPWAHFFANQIAVVIAFWAVWQTGRRIVGESGACVGALLLTGVAYYNVISPEFNPNVLQLPFWALMGWSFHRAVKDNHTMDWLVLGLWSAGGLYAKYSTILLLLTLCILMIAHSESRKRLVSKGPWLAVLTAALLSLPHFIWLANHHFMPFTYAEDRFEPLHHDVAFLTAPALFIVWQVAALLPSFLIYGIAFGRGAGLLPRPLRSFDGMFLLFVTFGPFLMACVIAALFEVKIRNMWGAPFWNFIGLWAVFWFRPIFSPEALRRFVYGWSFVFMAGIIGFAGLSMGEPYITHKAGRIYFPGRALAEQITDVWHQRYHTPLRYVIGDIWVAGNVAYYASERPHVLIAGDYTISPWIMPEDIKKYGAVLVWCRGSCTSQDTGDIPPYYWSEFPHAAMQSILTFPQQTAARVPPAKIGWAILPPEE